MTIQQSQPLLASVPLSEALTGHSQFDPFTREWLHQKTGLSELAFDSEWHRALTFRHIEILPTVNIGGKRAFKKGVNFYL